MTDRFISERHKRLVKWAYESAGQRMRDAPNVLDALNAIAQELDAIESAGQAAQQPLAQARKQRPPARPVPRPPEEK